MSKCPFQIYKVTTPKGDWYGVEEVRKQSWGTTHHPVMDGLKPLVLQDTYTRSFHEQIDLKEKIALNEIDNLVKEAKMRYTK